eukprot:scaffold156834_cov12-Tisochrysis_lutea.AAC.1
MTCGAAGPAWLRLREPALPTACGAVDELPAAQKANTAQLLVVLLTNYVEMSHITCGAMQPAQPRLRGPTTRITCCAVDLLRGSV